MQMKKGIIIVLMVLLSAPIFGQIGETINKRYFDIDDEDRITLLKQEDIKKNKIDLSLYIKEDTISRKPEFIDEKGFKQLKFPLDTSKNFEIEIEITLDGKKSAMNIYGAARPEKVDTNHQAKDDILVQFDMWTDGIYNVLQRLHSSQLLGVADLKKVRSDHQPDKRKITIRKINGDFEFYVNTNLILVILPPDPVNEIGFILPRKSLKIDSIMISYIADFED
jgi:hypothetical protein